MPHDTQLCKLIYPGIVIIYPGIVIKIITFNFMLQDEN